MKLNIALLPGDGIGPEVVNEAIKVLDKVGEVYGHRFIYSDVRAGGCAIDEDGDEMTFRLYPIGEDEFGRKGGLLKLKFGGSCVMYDGFTCKKL